MEFPLTWKPYGYHSCSITRESGDVKCECGIWPREFAVELHSRSGYEIHSCCSRCVDGYLPSTDLGGEPSIIGDVLTGPSSSSVKVVLAEFEPGDIRWTVAGQYRTGWEPLGTGWCRTRTGAVLSWIMRCRDAIVSVTDEFSPVLRCYKDHKWAELQAKRSNEEAESRRKEAEYQRSNTYWIEVENRARGMKGRKGEIGLTMPAGKNPIVVNGFIYGDFGLHRNPSKYERNQFKVTHRQTGLAVGEGFPTQIEAKMAICRLLESEVDWKNTTENTLSDSERLTIRAVLLAVKTRVPEAVVGAVA